MTSRLNALAYRMLGSVHDAEEVVQEARLKLHALKHRDQLDSEDAFLYRMVANLCIDRLRQKKRARQAYFGPWLPEPVAESDGIAQVELAEELTMGFMVLLERLSPVERIVFVLRESFDLSYAEVAELLGVSPENARQRAHRARRRLRGEVPAQKFPDDECKAMLEKMVALIGAGDIQGLMDTMNDDVVAVTDGGGVVSAAIAPVHGRQRIATVTLHLAQRAMNEGTESQPTTFSTERFNDTWALVVRQGNAIHSMSFIEGEAGKVSRIFVMRNPDKMAHIA